MPIKDVNSQINTTNTTSKLRGNLRGWSPGAKSDPGRGANDSVPSQPAHVRVSRNSDEPAQIRTYGPEDE